MSFTPNLRAALLVCAAIVSCAALPAWAHSYTVGAITLEHPHANATGPGQANGGAYVTLVNAGGDDRLLSVSSTVAKSTELHEMKMEGDIMRMRQIDGIALPAGKTVALKPGGLHIMLLDLKAPLQAGSQFPLKLKFEKAGEVTVDVHVEAAGGMADMHH